MHTNRTFRFLLIIVITFVFFHLTANRVPAQTESTHSAGSVVAESLPPMPQGSATVEISATSTALQLGNLPLTIAPTANAPNTNLTVRATTLDPQQAYDLTLLGFAFQLDITDGERQPYTANELLPLELTLEYGRIPLHYGGSLADRLTLYRASDCQIETIPPAEQKGKPQREEPAHEVLNCTSWQPLALRNDRANQQLIVDLSVDANANPPDPADFSPTLQQGEDYAPTKDDLSAASQNETNIQIERHPSSNGAAY